MWGSMQGPPKDSQSWGPECGATALDVLFSLPMLRPNLRPWIVSMSPFTWPWISWFRYLGFFLDFVSLFYCFIDLFNFNLCVSSFVPVVVWFLLRYCILIPWLEQWRDWKLYFVNKVNLRIYLRIIIRYYFYRVSFILFSMN